MRWRDVVREAMGYKDVRGGVRAMRGWANCVSAGKVRRA